MQLHAGACSRHMAMTGYKEPDQIFIHSHRCRHVASRGLSCRCLTFPSDLVNPGMKVATELNLLQLDGLG